MNLTISRIYKKVNETFTRYGEKLNCQPSQKRQALGFDLILTQISHMTGAGNVGGTVKVKFAMNYEFHDKKVRISAS